MQKVQVTQTNLLILVYSKVPFINYLKNCSIAEFSSFFNRIASSKKNSIQNNVINLEISNNAPSIVSNSIQLIMRRVIKITVE